MYNINKFLNTWLQELKGFTFPNYENFPDIDLYMDQVITYFEKHLSVFATSSLDRQITPSMVNNYVKGEVISPPISKKYNAEHLSAIEEICTLKQALSIAEIKQVLDIRYNDSSRSKGFNEYKALFDEKKNNVVDEALDSLNNIESNDITALANLALMLAVNANAYATVSKRILFFIKLLKTHEEEETEKAKKNKKLEEDFEEAFSKEK